MNLLKLMPAVLSVFFLYGCASATKMYAPDGKEMIAIDCSGAAISPTLCYKKASEVCGDKGYVILGKDGEATPASSGYGHVNAYQGLVVQQSGMIVHRNLYIRCN